MTRTSLYEGTIKAIADKTVTVDGVDHVYTKVTTAAGALANDDDVLVSLDPLGGGEVTIVAEISNA